jgi:Lipase (class 3)
MTISALQLIQRNAQLSTLANVAYNTPPPAQIGNWVYVTESSPSSSGFFGVAYRNTETNQIVISFRGTDGSGDLGTDWGFVTGGWRSQFSEAAKFTNQVQNDPRLQEYYRESGKPLVTGHSLGGGIAQIIAKMFGLDGAAIPPKIKNS